MRLVAITNTMTAVKTWARATTAAIAMATLAGCSGQSEEPPSTAAATGLTSSAPVAPSPPATTAATPASYSATPQEQEFIDTILQTVSTGGGGPNGPAAAVLTEVRYRSGQSRVDLVTAYGNTAEVDRDVATTLCSVVELAESHSPGVTIQLTQLTNASGRGLTVCAQAPPTGH